MARLAALIIILSSLLQSQLPPDDFRQRRQAILDRLGPADRMLVLTRPVFIRNSDQDHPFRPDSDFWYLTGFWEPRAVLVLSGSEISFSAGGETVSGREFLFLREKNPRAETWTGRRLGVAAAPARLRIEQAVDIDHFSAALGAILQDADTAYMNLSWSDAAPPLDALAEATLQYLPPAEERPRGPFRRVRALAAKLRRYREALKAGTPQLAYRQAGDLIHPLRLIKSPAEIELLQKAIDITAAGLLAAMRRSGHGVYEYQLQASVEFAFKDRGAKRSGYEAIVGSGPNALILHYNENERRMQAGELVLMDVGAEYQMYTVDITRTFPVSGRFSDAQREVYNAVLTAQEAAVAALKPGVTFAEINKIARESIEAQGYGKFILHGVSHWIGLDVHDVGGRSTPLAPGVVLTVEPGIYIPTDAESVAAEYRGIGVRIEDDYLITPEGAIHMSRDIPRTVGQIEAIMSPQR